MVHILKPEKSSFFDNLVKIARYILYIVVIVLTIAASLQYRGYLSIYILFTVISNSLLFFSFRKNAIFFDTFIGIFFWLGFWLKLTIRVAFTDGLFHEAIGDFDGSGSAFDRSLLISSCGFLGLLISSFLREKYFFNYPDRPNEITQKGLFAFYQAHRTLVLSIFLAFIVAVGASNMYLGIYQKGAITETTLPFGLNGIYKWLLMFGLASFSALIVRFELVASKRPPYTVAIISLAEAFISSVSLLSRGMVLNSAALFYGLLHGVKYVPKKSNIKFFITFFLAFVLLFGTSVVVVNKLRIGKGLFPDEIDRTRYNDLQVSMATPLFVDRWVGIEGVMAVSSSPKVGWSLWSEALKERYSENTTSFYDDNLIMSPYIDTDKTKHHYISLPGMIAFFFYPGSYMFLFVCTLMMGGIAAFLEFCTFHLGGRNQILCSLFAQVIAYRFSCFGYVPSQSYLLFGTLFLNLILIYLIDKFMRKCLKIS